MGSETILPEEEAIKIRRELVGEINIMLLDESLTKERKTYLGKIKNALINNSLMCDFYWDTDELPRFACLEKHNVALGLNCTFFRKDKVGLWASISEELYTERKKVKKEMLKVEQKIVDLKNIKGYDKQELKKLERQQNMLHTLQWGYKIALNSLYGATSNKFFSEYFDIRLAEAVTSAGQNGIQYIGKRVDDYFNKVLKTKDKKFVVYQDTDSCYIDVNLFVERLCQGKSKDEIVNFLDKLFSEKMEPLFIKWAKELSTALNCKSNQLVFKREKIIENAIFCAPKRNTLKVWDSEGVRYNDAKYTITGLEAVRSTYKQVWRNWLKEVYILALNETDETSIHGKVKEIEKQFRLLPIHDIATVISCNDIEKHQIGDFDWASGTTKQVKAALNYRKLKDKHNLNISEIASGDKILMVNLVKNPMGMDVIGFPEYLPEEFKLNKYIDYPEIFKKNFLDPLDTFLGAIGWSPKKRASVKTFFE